ncbi:MAG: S1C family serine protease [Candidatus Dojkabacteria bacterium]|jgi:serine protease Do
MEEKKKEKKISKDSTVEVKKSGRNLKRVGYFLLGILLLFSAFVVVAVTASYYTYMNFPKLQEVVSKITGTKEDENIELISSNDGEEKKTIVVNESEKLTIDIVKEASPSVVSIAVSQISLSQSKGIVDQNNNIGTGFIVDSSGVIITNQHVVSGKSDNYKVVTSDGEEYAVKEILRDDLYDIAILKIDAGDKTFKAIKLGDSDSLVVGQSVLAIGTPLGEFAGSVTTGIISGLNRSVTASSSSWFGSTAKTYEGVIQTDAAINSGNSGGPLINSQGEVVGVNFATTSSADNISFSIPINKVKNRLEEYRTYGKFIKPYLGVSYQMISEYSALYYSNVVPGALIAEVDASGPAYAAGIRRGDIITKFGGEDVKISLGDMIQSHKVGEEVEVEVNRSGETLTFKVKLGEVN